MYYDKMDDYNSKGDDDWMDAGAEYSPKSEFSKPRVVEEAVTRCVTLRAKEMKKGYYNTTFTKEGLPLKQWIEDSRKAYCSAVQALKTLMMPEILTEQKEESKEEGKGKDESKEEHKGKNKKKQTRIFSKILKIDNSFKEYAYYLLDQQILNGKVKYIKTKKYYMPDIDAIVQVRKIFPDGSEQLISVNGFWNSRVDAYWDNMIILNDQLFEQLIMVVHRLNYFKSNNKY